MYSAAIIFLAFGLLVIQSTFAYLFVWDMFIPSLSLPIVFYLGMHEPSLGRGSLLAFAIGYLSDVFAGSPMGLHTLVAVAIFLMSRIAGLRLFLQGWIFEVILAFFLALLSSLMILGFRALFDQDFRSLLSHLEIVFFRAAATACVAPLIFKATAKVGKFAPQRRTGEGRILRS